MSDQVRYKGWISRTDNPREVALHRINEDENLLIQFQKRTEHMGFEDPVEFLIEEGVYIQHGDDVYLVHIEEKSVEPDFVDSRKVRDGLTEFHTSFYTGGCCLEEVLTDILYRQT